MMGRVFTLMVGVGLAVGSVAQAATFTWNGTGNASDPANWLEDGSPTANLPGASDTVELDGTSTGDMLWDAGGTGLTQTVAAWTQSSGYTGTVTFDITYANANSNGFNQFAVTGNATVDGGTWTHQQGTKTDTQSNPDVYKLDVSIGGDFTLGVDGAINVLGKGYKYRTSGGLAGSHGGAANGEPSYGSLLDPQLPGMGGKSSGGSQQYGGGVVLLDIGGNAVVDGEVNASGQFWTTHSSTGRYSRSAAGGSINITADTFAGAGDLLVQGGLAQGSTGASGGAGGRIAVRLTQLGADFAGFTGSVDARPGPFYNNGEDDEAAGGSIYLQDGAGVTQVIVDFFGVNGDADDLAHVLTSENLSAADVIARNKALLELDQTRDLASLTVVDGSSSLVLSNASITSVQALHINGVDYSGGLYDSDDLGSQVSGDGFINVIPEPATLGLLAIGGLTMLSGRRRRA